MFGLEILDVILGLAFVYFLLSIVCSAANEYLASMLNKRGKVLKDGLERLLRDSGLQDAFYRHPLIQTYFRDNGMLEEREKKLVAKWPYLRRVYQFFTWIFYPSVRECRYPSYIPARTVAMALLEVYEAAAKPAAAGGGAVPGGAGPAPPAGAPDPDAPEQENPEPGAVSGANVNAGSDGGSADSAGAGAPVVVSPDFARLVAALRRESGVDVAELSNVSFATALAGSTLAADVKAKLIEAAVGVGNPVAKLHDSLEVWFNNGMDRVSGAYKRHTQHVLFWIGLILALAVNADTIDMWRRLSTDDKFRDGLAAQAVAYVATQDSLAAHAESTAVALDTATAGEDDADDTAPVTPDSAADTTVVPTDTTADTTGVLSDTTADTTAVDTDPDTITAGPDSTTLSQVAAKARYDSAMAELKRTGLNLGWSPEDAAALGILRKKTPREIRADSIRAARALVREAAKDDSSTAYRAARRAGGGAADAARAGGVRADSTRAAGARALTGPRRSLDQWAMQGPRDWHWRGVWAKLLGLLITATALSLGAPFWFDMLNKIINVRAAGRAPHELPRKPEAGGKRAADTAPK